MSAAILPSVQSLRRQALGTTTASNPFYFVRRRFQKLYSDFEPNRKYWRILVLIRKIMLAFTTVLFVKWPIFQVGWRLCVCLCLSRASSWYGLPQGAASLAVMFGAYVLHSIYWPYMHRENVPLTFYDVAHAELNAFKANASKELAAMAKLARTRVVRYVFNYNALEGGSIIVSTSILICGMVWRFRNALACIVVSCGV
jgi:hypothetical protein